MAKIGAEEIKPTEETATVVKEEAHPYAFHVSGPRNVASPNWRDLINSSWSVTSRFVLICVFFKTWVLSVFFFLKKSY